MCEVHSYVYSVVSGTIGGTFTVLTAEHKIFGNTFFAFQFVIYFHTNVFLRFLLLVYRQSMEQINISVFNFCDEKCTELGTATVRAPTRSVEV